MSRARQYPALILALVCLPVFIGALDLTIVSAVLPEVIRSLTIEIQAFGAGAMVPVSMALVADLYPPEKRALPLGIIGAVDTAGWVLGHLYGGIMVQFMSWPYLFWINLPVVFVIFGITWWGLKGLPRMDVKGGIDWIGVTLLGAALIVLNIGLGAPEVGLEGSAALPSP